MLLAFHISPALLPAAHLTGVCCHWFLSSLPRCKLGSHLQGYGLMAATGSIRRAITIGQLLGYFQQLIVACYLRSSCCHMIPLVSRKNGFVNMVLHANKKNMVVLWVIIFKSTRGSLSHVQQFLCSVDH
jgi:hypothetical protein